MNQSTSVVVRGVSGFRGELCVGVDRHLDVFDVDSNGCRKGCVDGCIEGLIELPGVLGACYDGAEEPRHKGDQ